MTIEEKIEKINALEKQLEALKSEVKTERVPEYKRKNFGEQYYSLTLTNVVDRIEEDDMISKMLFNANNYFYTKEEAQNILGKIQFMRKLQRLKDIYCPDYVPDWSDDQYKYTVEYDHEDSQWLTSCNLSLDGNLIYFESREIANKVCDILNAEDVKPT